MIRHVRTIVRIYTYVGVDKIKLSKNKTKVCLFRLV